MLDTNYIKALDDEICGDVYFYHNQINDKIDLYTVGCEISEWDGEKVAELLNTEELKEDIIIFNTCAVTDLAQTGSEKVAERLAKLYPEKKIYFIGCGVNYNKSFYEKYGTAILNKDKFNHKKYNCNTKNENYNFTLNTRRVAGVVKIEDGCYNNCTYCIIHKIREHYMVPYEKIKKQITTLIEQGRTVIQLLGTEITTYNYNGMDLTALCRKILEDFPEISYLVLGALDPASKQIDSLIELIKENHRVSNKLYLCTQSCSDTILKAMGRRHNAERLREINRLAGNDVKLILQLIVGFPGETDELFQETVDFIREIKPVDYDAIVFSPRKGTPAYDLPNRIPKEVTDKRERIIYNLIKSYTKENDFGSERAFDKYEKNQIMLFNQYRPKSLEKSIVFNEDLYDTNVLIKLFNILPKYNQDHRDIVIITAFDNKKDIYDLDVNVKLLTMTFGVKVIAKITVDDNFMNFVSNTYYSISNISYRLCLYLEFDFDKLHNTTEEQLVNLFKAIQHNNIDNLNVMTEKLIRSGNSKYLKCIFDNFKIVV